MVDKILLKAEGNQETVSAFRHVYEVTNGFVLVDVTPYRRDEPMADAAVDANEICKLAVMRQMGPQVFPAPLFRPATAAEVEEWKKKGAKGT